MASEEGPKMKIVYEKADPRGEPWPRDEIGFLEDGGEVIPRSRRRPYFPIALAKAEEYKEIPKGVENKRKPADPVRAVAWNQLIAFLLLHPAWREDHMLGARFKQLYSAVDAKDKARLKELHAAVTPEDMIE